MTSIWWIEKALQGKLTTLAKGGASNGTKEDRKEDSKEDCQEEGEEKEVGHSIWTWEPSGECYHGARHFLFVCFLSDSCHRKTAIYTDLLLLHNAYLVIIVQIWKQILLMLLTSPSPSMPLTMDLLMFVLTYINRYSLSNVHAKFNLECCKTTIDNCKYILPPIEKVFKL